jgi:hypothetical protein
MMQVIVNPRVTALRDKLYGALVQLHFQISEMSLRSRRGEGNAIWTILVIGLIAVVATVALFPIGQRLITMGQEAASKLQSPPW